MRYTPFEYSVLKFIKGNDLISPGDRVILAVSGGSDSIAMMYAMAKLREELQADFFVAHLNHMIRKEAEKEGVAVKSMAEKLGMPCLIGKKDVPTFQKKASLSLEEAARMLRYEFFEEALNFFRAEKVATAHHLSDLAENFFIRLFRGSGVGGLIGMRAMNGKYIKPFLFLDEETIREYVTIRRLEHFEDKTNADLKYLRNKIRHELMPFIRSEFCPDIERKIQRSVRILEEYEDFIRSDVEGIMKKGQKDRGGRLFFKTSDFKGKRLLLGELTKRVLWERGISISARKLELVVRLISKGSGEVRLAQDFFAVKYNDTLFFGKKPSLKAWKAIKLEAFSDVNLKVLDMRLRVERRSNDGRLGDGKKEAVVDAKKIAFPLYLRTVEEGDTMVPLGMREKKKVISLLKSRKIPAFLRKIHPVVVQNDGKIVWVVGVAISEEFKVTSETREVLVFGREGGNFF